MSKKWMTAEDIAAKEKARLARERATMIQGAKNYAGADRTDPFAFSRAMSHINNGVASFRRPENRELSVEQGDAFYQATPYREGRTMIGSNGQPQEYSVVRYMNVQRP